MTRSDPPLPRSLWTRSDPGDGSPEAVRVLGAGANGDPVFPSDAPELRRELVPRLVDLGKPAMVLAPLHVRSLLEPRLDDLGKPAVVLTPLHVRSLLVRAGMTIPSSPVEQAYEGLDTPPGSPSVEIETADEGADQLAVQGLATVLQELATEIGVDVQAVRKLAEQHAPLDAVGNTAPGTRHEHCGDAADREQDSDASAADDDARCDLDDPVSAVAVVEEPTPTSFVDGADLPPAGSAPHAEAIGEPTSEPLVAAEAVADDPTAPNLAAVPPPVELAGEAQAELADEASTILTAEPPAQTVSAAAVETSSMQSDGDPIESSIAWPAEPAAMPASPATAATAAVQEVTDDEFSGLPNALDVELPAELPAEVTAELEPSRRNEPTPVIAAPTPEPEPEPEPQPLRPAVDARLPSEAIVAGLDRTMAALDQTGVSMQRVESFLGELTQALDDLSHRPPPPPLDVQPLVEAVQVAFERATARRSATNAVLTTLSDRLGGLGQQVEHGMQQVVAALSVRADEPRELPRATPAAAPGSSMVAPAERSPIALLALAALVLGWSVLFWFKTDSQHLALGTLIAANLVGCSLLLQRRLR
jgi:hypothetical protein